LSLAMITRMTTKRQSKLSLKLTPPPPLYLFSRPCRLIHRQKEKSCKKHPNPPVIAEQSALSPEILDVREFAQFFPHRENQPLNASLLGPQKQPFSPRKAGLFAPKRPFWEQLAKFHGDCKKRQGTTSVVPLVQQEDVGLYRLRKNSNRARFVTRARLQSGHKCNQKKGWASAPAGCF